MLVTAGTGEEDSMHHALHFQPYFHCVSAKPSKIKQSASWSRNSSTLFSHKPISFGLYPAVDIFSTSPPSAVLLIYGG